MDKQEKPKSQFDKFKEAAREVETDDREEAFDAIVKKVAKAPPKDDKFPPQKRGRA
jgi:hypothetical protein